MAAYSMDIRTRVLQDSDAGMTADAVAEKYRVSASWVRRYFRHCGYAAATRS